MWTLWPQPPALKVTENSMTLGPAAACHLHPSAGQQNPQELPHTPATAQLLQQPPRVPHRKLLPSYPAALHSHFGYVPSVRPAGCSASEADYELQQHSLQAKPEMGMLQLLANSDPVLTADELLARLRSAATAEAPAHHGGSQGHQCSANMHEGAIMASSTRPHQTVFATGKFYIALYHRFP